MATWKRNLFLYLALACFVGIVAIFVVDGYLGVYDTIYVTASEREQKVEPEFQVRGDYPWSTSVNRDEKAFFRYEVDNRFFSQYSTILEVSVWRMQEKVLDMVSQPIAVAPFDKAEIEWVLDTGELKPADIPAEQGYQYSVVIERGDIQHTIILYVNPSPFPKAPLPAEVIPRG